jgi:uncharacterized BrkB/YihY/UPF0761 family membrane protein
MAAPKNILSRLPEGFWATVLVSVLALIVVVGLGYMAVSVLSDVAKLPSSPAAPSGGGDFVLPDPISKLIAFIFLGICLCIYFLPTIVAFRRQKRDCVAIGALNLLLGWTLIGWAVSLVWALKND